MSNIPAETAHCTLSRDLNFKIRLRFWMLQASSVVGELFLTTKFQVPRGLSFHNSTMFPSSRLFKRAFHSSRKNLEIITAVLPGQGNVSPHLFKIAHYQIEQQNNPKYKQLVEIAQEVIPEEPMLSLFFQSLTYPDSKLSKSLLSKTSFVQPLVLLATYINYMGMKDLFDWNLKTLDYMLGHSLGELSGLVIQDVISLEDGLRIAYKRGKLMEDALLRHSIKDDEKWGMFALMFQERDFLSILKVCQENIKFNIANINGYGQIVVSGRMDDLNHKLHELDIIQKQMTAAKQWKSRIRKIKLQTDIPAHHPIFNDIKEELREMITLQSETLQVPMVCNLNGLVVVKNSQRAVDNFIDVTSKPVEFVKCLETIVPMNHDPNEMYKFFNLSDVTYGLIKRFFNTNENVKVYDLIKEAEKRM